MRGGGSKEKEPPSGREDEIRRRECEDFAPQNGAARVRGERGAKRGRRRLPGRPHSGPCSGICTRKSLHFYTQSCIIIPTSLKTPRRSGFTAIPVRKLLRIHIITVRKRPCGCVRSVFVFRDGKESRRDHNRIPEGSKQRDHNRIPEGSKQRDHNGIPKGYNTKHNRARSIAERLREMGI